MIATPFSQSFLIPVVAQKSHRTAITQVILVLFQLSQHTSFSSLQGRNESVEVQTKKE